MIAPIENDGPRNVLGEPLQPCCTTLNTGWFRNGSCETDQNDLGKHVVCTVMTEEFLSFSQAMGNDLSTPMPAYNFPGLKEGDCWCLCAARCSLGRPCRRGAERRGCDGERRGHYK